MPNILVLTKTSPRCPAMVFTSRDKSIVQAELVSRRTHPRWAFNNPIAKSFLKLELKTLNFVVFCCYPGVHICREAWFAFMGIGRQRMTRCKRFFHGKDLRSITGTGGISSEWFYIMFIYVYDSFSTSQFNHVHHVQSKVNTCEYKFKWAFTKAHMPLQPPRLLQFTPSSSICTTQQGKQWHQRTLATEGVCVDLFTVKISWCLVHLIWNHVSNRGMHPNLCWIWMMKDYAKTCWIAWLTRNWQGRPFRLETLTPPS